MFIVKHIFSAFEHYRQTNSDQILSEGILWGLHDFMSEIAQVQYEMCKFV